MSRPIKIILVTVSVFLALIVALILGLFYRYAHSSWESDKAARKSFQNPPPAGRTIYIGPRADPATSATPLPTVTTTVTVTADGQ